MGVVWADRRNGSTRGRQGANTRRPALLSLPGVDEHSRTEGEATPLLYEHSPTSFAALARVHRRTRRLLAAPHDPGA